MLGVLQFTPQSAVLGGAQVRPAVAGLDGGVVDGPRGHGGGRGEAAGRGGAGARGLLPLRRQGLWDGAAPDHRCVTAPPTARQALKKWEKFFLHIILVYDDMTGRQKVTWLSL